MLCEAQQAQVERAVEDFGAADPGRSVVVESLRGTEVHTRLRADLARPAASLLKLPLVSAVRAAEDLDMGTRVRRDQLPHTAYSSVLAVLEPGHELTIGELCGLCLATSDNPAAVHLLSLVGMEAVNERAAALGATSTRMEVGFGDAELDSPGLANVTTADDALAMLRRILAEDPQSANALANNLHNSRISLRLAGTNAPHKTGTLEGAVNDVGVVFGRETDLALAFLCDGQPDSAATSIEIGDCVARILRAVGEGGDARP